MNSGKTAANDANREEAGRNLASISPFFVGLMFARPAFWSVPFFLAGTLKIVYDVVLYRQFVGARPPEEVRQ